MLLILTPPSVEPLEKASYTPEIREMPRIVWTHGDGRGSCTTVQGNWLADHVAYVGDADRGSRTRPSTVDYGTLGYPTRVACIVIGD